MLGDLDGGTCPCVLAIQVIPCFGPPAPCTSFLHSSDSYDLGSIPAILTHKICLLFAAISGLMKLACLQVYFNTCVVSAHAEPNRFVPSTGSSKPRSLLSGIASAHCPAVGHLFLRLPTHPTAPHPTLWPQDCHFTRTAHSHPHLPILVFCSREALAKQQMATGCLNLSP